MDESDDNVQDKTMRGERDGIKWHDNSDAGVRVVCNTAEDAANLAKQLNSTHFINILQPTELGLPGHLLSMKMSLKFQEQCVVVPLLMIEGGM